MFYKKLKRSTYSLITIIQLNTLLGLILYYLSYHSLMVSVLYSCFSAVMSVCAAFSLRDKARSWLFWFTLTYFLFYQFGTILGVLFEGFSVSFIDYPTNFSNNLTKDSISISYVISGLCISMIWSLYPFFSVRVPINRLGFDSNLFRAGCTLALMSYPIMVLELLNQLAIIHEHGYAYFYTREFQLRNSVVPFIGFFSTICYLSFFIIFASKPPLSMFRLAAILFLFLACLDVLKGARTALIIPMLFIIWHLYLYYNLRLNTFKLFIFALSLVVFALIVQFIRSEAAASWSYIFQFLVQGISKAQHILAVVIDNRDLVEVDSVFILEPILFPVLLAKYGHRVVGQSSETAELRFDLNHSFSSQLNFGAYLDGAGLGSSFVAEAIQFGPLFLFLVIFFWFSVNSLFFLKAQSFRILFFLQPYIFMHLIMSPRSTVFMGSWMIIKAVVFYVFVLSIIFFLKSVSAKRS